MSPLLQAAHAYAADEAKQLQPPDVVKAIDVTAEPISPQSSSQSSQPLPEGGNVEAANVAASLDQ